MRKNYTHFLIVFASLLLAIPSFAQEAMNVMSKETSISSTQLESIGNITFSESQILIHLTDGSVVNHNFDAFDNIIFGEYISSVDINELNSNNPGLNVYLSGNKILTVESSAIIKSLKLVDLSGKATKVNLSGNVSNRVSASVASLTAGVYIVLADTENGVQTFKIIIK